MHISQFQVDRAGFQEGKASAKIGGKERKKERKQWNIRSKNKMSASPTQIQV